MRTRKHILGSRHLNLCLAKRPRLLLAAVWSGLAAFAGVSQVLAQTTATITPGVVNATNAVRIVSIEGGPLEISPPGASDWVPTTSTNAPLGVHYRLRTGAHTRVRLLLSNASTLTMGDNSQIEILPPRDSKDTFGSELVRGIQSFFHRDKSARMRTVSHASVAGVEGTEFVMEVVSNGPTVQVIVSVVDGIVRFSNPQGTQVLTNNQESVSEPGRPPSPPVGFNVNNRLQWCFYYPAVLDLHELPLAQVEETILAGSLRAYRLGDLLSALRLYPTGRQPGSDAERIYYAALLLSVGQAAQAEAVLAALPPGTATDRIKRLAAALRQLIAAVRLDPNRPQLRQFPPTTPQLSTELLAASYYEQSLAVREESLKSALSLARTAATNSPDFGFAWARVAELEFSFGRTTRAEQAFERSYALSPLNAEALSLEGFLLAAQNRTRQAIQWFDYAIAADPGLGNAWLGRGLCRIHQGDFANGEVDLLLSAALEPQRALMHSYLGKAYGEQGDFERATKELDRAKYLDPKDPTAWLYSALLNQQHNRINEAIRDLERSEELNDNRSVYRSSLLLDEDRAVRSANLAAIYRDAGMFDVSLREASRAVNYDYANYSAHLFLAESFQELADPKLINRRYETPTEVEYLISNLLAPVDAGPLSQAISQQQFSKLFHRNRLGLISSTDYTTRGDWTQTGAQFGNDGTSSYSVEGAYKSQNGERSNNDLELRNVSILLKHQLSQQDAFLFEASDSELSGGDLFQRYDPNDAATDYRFKEKQNPVLLIGYHREWSPGMHTLFLATRLADEFSFTNSSQPTLLGRTPGGPLQSLDSITMHEDFASKLEIYTSELQQIWEQQAHTTLIGSRFQYGHFKNDNLQNIPSSFVAAFNDPAALQASESLFRRLSFYGYHSWKILDRLQLSGGLAFDQVTFPANLRSAPLSDSERTEDRLSPKAGLIFTPAQHTALRFAYTRSLGGASLDQSFQLEPPQMAGFVQSFRSIIPESVAGANVGARFETFDISLEQTLPTRTYLAAGGEILNSDLSRVQGGFTVMPVQHRPHASIAEFAENLSFGEKSLFLTINQLVGDNLSIGARYRLTRAELVDELADLPAGISTGTLQPRQALHGTLHQFELDAIYNNASGIFAKFQALWNGQSNSGYVPVQPGDHFWQLNAFAGYRFARRKAEITVGFLNLTDRNYRLSPLTLYQELPHRRALEMQLTINF